MTFRRLSREYIGVATFLCLAGVALSGRADPAVENEKSIPAPIQLAVVALPAKSSAPERSTNSVPPPNNQSAPGQTVDRRRIQVLQRIEPEIIQSSPLVRPASLD